jgi:hypothetical protein
MPAEERDVYRTGEIVMAGVAWAIIAIVPALLVGFLIVSAESSVPTWLPMVVFPVIAFVLGVAWSYSRNR